ncbi:MAG TPA: hypothetical protein VHZ51_27395 [Ktedonobacteraceae bacterium]|nr:hypothetical protein [Ktedonobacteraceae bacterium]
MIISDVPPPNTKGWRTQQASGGMDARPETIRFVKDFSISHRQLHFVTFEDQQGKLMNFSCRVVEGSDGTWSMHGGSGGGGRGPQRSHPWANLGGGGWGQCAQFFAGGYVEDNGQDVALIFHVLKSLRQTT